MTDFRALALASLLLPASLMAGDKLSGTPIGTPEGFNYETGRIERDIQYRAFDGNLDTYFATNARSYTWVGLDLGTPHVIDRVGWAPRNDGVGPARVCLGVIQGANSPDFLDAVPIYMITQNGVIGRMSYASTDCSRGFRYVRFVSTGDSRCNIAELEFYGTPGAGDDSRLYQPTGLPLVVVNTVNSQEPYDKEHDITANIIIIDHNGIDTDKGGTIRERGNASRQFPKKPWRIKFDKKQSILDSPAKAKKWTLINNYGDKTLMRNLLAFEIARRLKMPYVAWARPVDVILNGEFKGCYQLCDQIEVNPDRVDITEMEPADNQGEALTGGYFIEIDAYADQELPDEYFISAQGIPVTIKSPDDGGTPEQRAYLKACFDKMAGHVLASHFGGANGDYRDYLDSDSFIRHFIVGELSGNTDTYWSTYMYKDRNSDKFFTGPVWDFDIAFENDNRTYPIHNTAYNYLYINQAASAAYNMREFANRILAYDARSRADITRIWSEARNSYGLDYHSMAGYIDALAADLEESQKLNFMRWPIMNEWVHQNPHIWGSYDAEVGNVKDYLKQRFADLDRLMRYDPTIMEVEEAFQSLRPVAVTAGGCISLSDGSRFSVVTPDGRTICSGVTTTPPLPSGIYIVTTPDRSLKIVL